jgi:undecaprenyl-diphosphatase
VSINAARACQRLDTQLFDAVVRRRRPVLDAPARVVAHVGRGGVIWVLAAAVGGRWRAAGAPPLPVTVATVGGVYGGSMLLARIIRRARPCHQTGVVPLVDCPAGPAFPSDQTAGAFAGALLTGAALPQARLPLLALASAIGLARVYCGVHWPADVAAGALAGTAAAATVQQSRKGSK